MLIEALNNINLILLNLEIIISKFIKSGLLDRDEFNLKCLKISKDKKIRLRWILSKDTDELLMYNYDINFIKYVQKPIIMECLKICVDVIERHLHYDEELISEFYHNCKVTNNISTHNNDKLSILNIVVEREHINGYSYLYIFKNIVNIAIRWSTFEVKTHVKCYQLYNNVERDIEKYFDRIYN